MKKINCWEFTNCGREKKSKDPNNPVPRCPAVTETSANGINGGENAGRICWAIAGTFCGDKVQGHLARDIPTCMLCDFFKKIKKEEGRHFKLLTPGQSFKLST